MAASVLPPPLREGDRLTRDEFMRRWEAMPDLRWAELIDGIVYMPSPVSRIHDDIHSRMSTLLGLYSSATPGCRSGVEGTWLMSADSVPQPDLTLEIDPNYGGQSWIEGPYSAGAPEMVVEISLTTRRKDRGIKQPLYERSGVREYITVEPQKIVYRSLVDSKYIEIASGKDGIYRSLVFAGLWIDSVALKNDDFPGLLATVQRGIATPEHADFVRKLASSR